MQVGGSWRLTGDAVAVVPVELVFLVDVSGSMAGEGKIQSLNSAMEEALPLLRNAATQLVTVRPFARVLTFGSTVAWVVGEAEPLSEFQWPSLAAEPQGMTELGLALDSVLRLLDVPGHASAPALILCTDGMPTDLQQPSFVDALAALDQHPLGGASPRAAVAIGQVADDDETLSSFVAASSGQVFSAQQPQQLAANIRLAGTAVLESASSGIW